MKDIEAGEELYANYGSGYVDDLEEGCPCRACNLQSYEAIKEEEYERQRKRNKTQEVDREVIADKKKEQKKRREKQRMKS